VGEGGDGKKVEWICDHLKDEEKREITQGNVTYEVTHVPLLFLLHAMQTLAFLLHALLIIFFWLMIIMKILINNNFVYKYIYIT